ncbi:MAG: sugar-binding domain-containing protein, partial [Chloroflexota bacterium]
MTVTSLPSVTADIPRPEHPRPDFHREPWLNLNGRWRFTFDPQNVGEQLRWHRLAHPSLGEVGSTDSATGSTLTEDPFGAEIVVPFPWESRLSEVNDPTCKGAAWYQRVIQAPAEWAEADTTDDAAEARETRGLPSIGDEATSTTAPGAGVTWRLRPFLCFGAVDWHARVWVNGRFAAEHAGGYTPFAVDLSRYLRPGRPATLTVRVRDTSDADTPIGKQTARWYTPSSGIWQTVWLEGRPAAYLTRIHVTPHLEQGGATFAVAVAATPESAGQQRRIIITSQDGAFSTVEQPITLDAEVTEATLEVHLPQPRAWSPEDPHLYECAVGVSPAVDGRRAGMGEPDEPDEVRTYFGLRSVSRGRWEDRPYEFVFLNGEPVYLRGALDQAFHPDTLHAYPSDQAIRADVQAA